MSSTESKGREAHTAGPWLNWETLEWLVEPQRLLANTEDARLIAAAPDLLEVVQAIDEHLPHFVDPDAVPESDVAEIVISLSEWRMIKQAIARATGESS